MATIEDLLEECRKELLDLSTRNRLLSIPVKSSSSRAIQVHDELSAEVYRLIVSEKKGVGFLHGGRDKKAAVGFSTHEIEDDDDEVGLPQPDDEKDESTGLAKRHVDSKLQTALTPEGLQRRLLDLYRDARTMIEEQGVNILYLVLGHLKWYEAEHADTPRFAPLILVPVELSRKSASERFVLTWTEDDIEENLSLRAKLKADFGIEMPAFPEEEKFNLTKYFEAIAVVTQRAKNWQILPNAMTLGFFSFAKFLMYRDLDPDNWPESESLLRQRLITGLLQDGFPRAESILSDDAEIDELIPTSRLDHVVDADGSQTLAIESVRQGISLVIQGPPGTGKSQSITNIIATAVLDGKKVLFVAEKLAALEVVKRRLEREGLGAICLELHSNKANKRAVIEEVGKTWKLGRPKHTNNERLIPRLDRRRTELNVHVSSLHELYKPSCLTPFDVIGRLISLGADRLEDAEVVLFGAEDWTPEQHQDLRKLVQELSERIRQIGLPTEHPWRGVCCEPVLSIDLRGLMNRIESAGNKLRLLVATSEALANALSRSAPKTFLEAEQQRLMAEYFAQAPSLDKNALNNGVWNAGIEGLKSILAEGRSLVAAQKAVRKQVTENVWEKNFVELRSQIAAHGRSLLRILNRRYRLAIAELRGCVIGELPKRHIERVAFVDLIIQGQCSLRRIRELDSVAKSAFGTIWRKEDTDWTQLEAILNWVSQQHGKGLGTGFAQAFTSVKDQEQLGQLAKEIAIRFSESHVEISQLFEQLLVDLPQAFGAVNMEQVNLDALGKRILLWLENPEGLSRWTSYSSRARSARRSGLAGLTTLLENGSLSIDTAVDCFDQVYFKQLFRDMVRKRPSLAEFDGDLHSRLVNEFKQLDTERIVLGKHRTLLAHFENMPQLNAEIGATGILKSEMERKRGHRTVRRLLKDAATAVQAIKPVFMMSPLSVAQFLEPGAVKFDLLVIDEASQVQPVDALGAIARSKQIVVVGDSKQLPPTRFFSRLTSSDETKQDEEDQAQIAPAQDIESILGLCRARGLQEKMLQWHYRSRHHSLIALSNHEFYEDKLFIVPSPYSVTASLGLKFIHVPEGVFDSGASGTNRIEAKAICRAVIEHARSDSKLSLGVAAFSVRQRQAILDELELLRRENPDVEPFFSDRGTEPFFVKNLENVQGDERDVIFISVGYGKDVHGYMAMRFGPLSNEGGERRLNVLISRAKRRCDVFSSITADDIDLERAPGRGVAAFKAFLSFAQTGRLSIAKRSGRAEDSPFEEAVRRDVESLGYEVHSQVGIAGFFVDLAVVDRQREGRYILGIECDGAAYHSSRSARDRDRLRQTVLEDHGWIIHRIWSTDWFQRPSQQLQKIAAALERAKIAIDDTKEFAPSVSVSLGVENEEGIERETVIELKRRGLSDLTTPYVEARFEIPVGVEPHELQTKDLAEIVLKIVNQEGPMHEDEVINRVRDLWGFGRAGNRIQDAVMKAIRSVLAKKLCSRDEGFLYLQAAPTLVRSRESVSSVSLRKPEMLPPSELRAAILAVIDAGRGAKMLEIPTAVARMLGFKSTGTQLRAVIALQQNKLLQQGAIKEVNELLQRVAPNAVDLRTS